MPTSIVFAWLLDSLMLRPKSGLPPHRAPVRLAVRHVLWLAQAVCNIATALQQGLLPGHPRHSHAATCYSNLCTVTQGTFTALRESPWVPGAVAGGRRAYVRTAQLDDRLVPGRQAVQQRVLQLDVAVGHALRATRGPRSLRKVRVLGPTLASPMQVCAKPRICACDCKADILDSHVALRAR